MLRTRSFTLAALIALAVVACGATIRTRTQVNPDGTQDTAYPNDAKNPTAPTFSWSATCLDSLLAVIANQTTGTATSKNVDSCASGTGQATATYSFVQTNGTTACSADWSISGSYPNRLLVNAGSNAGSGTCKLKAVVSGNTSFSGLYPWSYVVPASDTTAPNPVTGMSCTPASTTTIACTFDSTVDPADAVQTSGVKVYHFYRNGVLLTGQDLTAASAGMVNDFTAGAIGTASGTVVQTGASWAFSGNGGLGTEGTADGLNTISIPLNGSSFDVILRVSTLQAAGSDNKNGIEFRATLSSNSIANNCTFDLSDGVLFTGSRNRKTTGGSRSSDGQVATQLSASMPSVAYLKAHYDASGLDCYASLDGGAWTTEVTNYALAPVPTSKFAIVYATATNNGTSINVTDDFVSVNNVGTLSKTLSVASGTATFTVRAEDNAGNVSAVVAGSTTAPSTPTGGTIKFQPGVYGMFNKSCIPWDGVQYGCQTSEIVSTIQNEICANSYWQGLKLHTYPIYLIPNTASSGNYTGGTNQAFTAIDAILAALNVCNKYLILETSYGEFGGPDALGIFYPNFTYSTTCSPPILNCSGGTATGSNYGVVANTQSSQPGSMAKLWQNDWRDLAIAATAAYCARYDTNPAFYAIAILYYNLSLPIDVQTPPSGYSEAGFQTQFLAYLDAARTACPTTNVTAVLDYGDPFPAAMNTFLAKLESMHGTMTNTDTFPRSGGATWGQQVWAGQTGSPSVIDYRGRVRNIEEVETPEMCGNYGPNLPSTFHNYWRNGAGSDRARWPNHFVITLADECNPTYGTSAWKTFLNGLGGATIMNGRDNTLRTPAAVKASWCESSMTCP